VDSENTTSRKPKITDMAAKVASVRLAVDTAQVGAKETLRLCHKMAARDLTHDPVVPMTLNMCCQRLRGLVVVVAQGTLVGLIALVPIPNVLNQSRRSCKYKSITSTRIALRTSYNM